VTERLLTDLWRVGGDSWEGSVEQLSADGDANVYLLRHNGSATLVDCGTLAGRAAIEANIHSTGVASGDIAHLVLSHSHWDHSQAAAEWQADHRLRTHLNARGAEFLRDGDHRLVGYQLHGPGYAFTPFIVDHAIGDGERFDLDGVAVEAHFLPGHTPDSTLLVVEHAGRRVGFCGDVAFGGKADGVPRLGFLSSLWMSDLDEYVASLERLAAVPLDLLLPGHGAVVAGRAQIRAAVGTALVAARRLAGDAVVRANLAV
jgi:glyoxylase-like metal-dependent hydrolase (beta-lactamase superfamily II)